MNRVRVLDVVALALCAPLFAATIPLTLSQSREKIHRARCVSNLKTLWSAFATFAEEHDGYLPAAGWSDRDYEYDWTWGGNVVPVPQIDPAVCERIEIERGSLWPYVTGMLRVGPYGQTTKGPPDQWYSDPRKNVYLCPTAGPVGRRRGLSYSMNYYLEDPPVYAYDLGMRLPAIKNPSETILLVEETELTLNDGLFMPSGAHESGVEDLELKHSDGGHLLFCDGRVGWIHKDELLERMKQDPESFAPEL